MTLRRESRVTQKKTFGGEGRCRALPSPQSDVAKFRNEALADLTALLRRNELSSGQLDSTVGSRGGGVALTGNLLSATETVMSIAKCCLRHFGRHGMRLPMMQ